MKSLTVWSAVPLMRTNSAPPLLQCPSHLYIFVCLKKSKAMIKKLFALLTLVSLTFLSCEKPTPEPEPQDQTNYFTYEGYSFEINSVVKYDKGDNAIEIWLSPESGLTTTSSIESAGDYVVLNTNKDYLNKRDRFNAATSKGSYIRFGSTKEFAYGDNGTAYIEVAVNGDQITLAFMAQKLYTKAEAEVKAAITGEFSGAFVTETERPYENEWGIDRKRAALSKAVYTTYENGSDSEITLFEENGVEAVHMTFKPSAAGTLIYFPSADIIELTYNGGTPLALNNVTGSVKTSIADGSIEVLLDLTDGKQRIRASYSGVYEDDMVKENRYKYDYDGESPYEGRHDIVKLMVENKGGQCKLFFSPSDGYSIGTANSTHMPILTVPSDIINAGRKTFMEINGWEFAYDLMQVWPYDNEYKPHAATTDWIEINQSGDTYEVEFILSSNATGMPSSSIDLYVKAAATK